MNKWLTDPGNHIVQHISEDTQDKKDFLALTAICPRLGDEKWWLLCFPLKMPCGPLGGPGDLSLDLI